MGARKDLTGHRFGRLTAQRSNGQTAQGQYNWLCLCDCGKEVTVFIGNLTAGRTTSCGCRNSEVVTARNLKHGQNARGKRTPEYTAWCHMRARCNDPEDASYADYGGRGITVESTWNQSFETFYADMGPKPTQHHLIERRDNEKGYSKENCYWATRTEQNRNKRSNRWLTIDGVRKLELDWSREVGISVTTLRHRINSGWSAEDAVRIPVGSPRL